MGGGVDDVVVSRPAFHQLGGGDAGGDRQAAPESFAEAHDVDGSRVAGRAREHPTAPEAGPDLVGDQARAVLVDQRAQLTDEGIRGDHAAATTQHRLYQHGGHVARGQQLPHEAERGVEACAAYAGVGREAHLLIELLREGLSKGRPKAAGGQRPVPQAVVGAVEGDEGRLAGGERGRLERGGDRIAPRLAEQHLCVGRRVKRAQRLEQRQLDVAREQVTEALHQLAALRADRFAERRVAVPEEHRPKSGGEIDVAVAVDVDDGGPFACGEHDGIGVAFGAGARLAPVGEGRALDSCQPLEELARALGGAAGAAIVLRAHGVADSAGTGTGTGAG